MMLYYDESGTFTFPNSGPAISVVGLLIAPEGIFEQIKNDYLKIRSKLPHDNGEIKGKLMNEEDVAEIVSLLLNHDVLFVAVAIDMGLHSKAGIELSKDNLKKSFEADLTEDLHLDLVELTYEMNEKLSKLSLQLYIQSRLTFELIKDAIMLSTLYYCQRVPETLARFEWILDAKDKEKVTEGENWWKSTVAPIIAGDSTSRPFWRLNSGDYSYFQPYVKETPEHLKSILHNPLENTVLDTRQIITENFRFSSEPEIGLELVDILTNATRRALVGNLGYKGWCDIPQLMIQQRDYCIKLAFLENEKMTGIYPYNNVLHHFNTKGKVMLTRDRINEIYNQKMHLKNCKTS